MHVVERSVAIHRAHEGEYAGHLHAPGVGVFAGSALVGHSVMDGFAIGAAFQAGGTVGVVVSIAVLSHDFADALAPVIGAASTLLFTIPHQLLGVYLGFFAGVLLYLATADILPEAHAHHPSRLTLVCTVLGVGFMWLVIGLAG